VTPFAPHIQVLRDRAQGGGESGNRSRGWPGPSATRSLSESHSLQTTPSLRPPPSIRGAKDGDVFLWRDTLLRFCRIRFIRSPRHGYLPPETRYKYVAQASFSTGSPSHLLHVSSSSNVLFEKVSGGRYPYHGLGDLDSLKITHRHQSKDTTLLSREELCKFFKFHPATSPAQ